MGMGMGMVGIKIDCTKTKYNCILSLSVGYLCQSEDLCTRPMVLLLYSFLSRLKLPVICLEHWKRGYYICPVPQLCKGLNRNRNLST